MDLIRASSSLVTYIRKTSQNLNEKGFIRRKVNKFLSQGPSICAYKLNLDKYRIYIGSAINIALRFRQHRYRCSVYKNNKSKFGNLVIKPAWNNIELGIIE